MPNSAPRVNYLLIASFVLALLLNGMLIVFLGYLQSRAAAVTLLHPRRVDQYIAEKPAPPLPESKPGAPTTSSGSNVPGSGSGASAGATSGQGGAAGGAAGAVSSDTALGRPGSASQSTSPGHPSTPSGISEAEKTRTDHARLSGHNAGSGGHVTAPAQQPTSPAGHPGASASHGAAAHSGNAGSHTADAGKHGNGSVPHRQGNARHSEASHSAHGNGTSGKTNTGGNAHAGHGAQHADVQGHGTPGASGMHGSAAGSHGTGAQAGTPGGASGQAGTGGSAHTGSSATHSDGQQHGPAGGSGHQEIASAGHVAGSQGGEHGNGASGAAGTHGQASSAGANSSAGHGNGTASGTGSAGKPAGPNSATAAGPLARGTANGATAGSAGTGQGGKQGDSGATGGGANGHEAGAAGSAAGSGHQADDALTGRPYPTVTYKISGSPEMAVHYRNPEAQKLLDARDVQGAALDPKIPSLPSANESSVDTVKDPLTYPFLPPFVPQVQGKSGGVEIPTVLPIPQTFDVGALSWRGVIPFPSHFVLVPAATGRTIPPELRGDGSGLLGLYYLGANFDHFLFRRADRNIAIDWSHRKPDARMPISAYSVRWVGSIIPRYSERYTIYTATDDGVRFWIDGKQVIDKWQIQAVSENSFTIDMVAGHPYDFVMEFFEKNGMSYVQAYLYWQSAHQPKENIPESCLRFPDWLWDSLK